MTTISIGSYESGKTAMKARKICNEESRLMYLASAKASKLTKEEAREMLLISVLFYNNPTEELDNEDVRQVRQILYEEPEQYMRPDFDLPKWLYTKAAQEAIYKLENAGKIAIVDGKLEHRTKTKAELSVIVALLEDLINRDKGSQNPKQRKSRTRWKPWEEAFRVSGLRQTHNQYLDSKNYSHTIDEIRAILNS